MKKILSILALTFCAATAMAQEEEKADTTNEKKKIRISVGSDDVLSVDGISNKDKEKKAFRVSYFMFDIGINSIDDKTDYSSAAAQNFLQVPDVAQNENLFSLRTGKSVNVNIWPVIGKFRVMQNENQKMYLSFGAGLQMYNFRFNKNISYLNNPNPMVVNDSVAFTKNKLGLTYLSIPLMATFKTRLAGKTWLVYGAGITGGYRIGSWTKQVSAERGKQKNHDQFNFNNFNSCVTGEIGLSGYFRIYATYQLTALHDNVLSQHPFCIGLRFGGV